MSSDILNAFDGLAATFESDMGSAVGSSAYGLLEATVRYNILWYHEASSTVLQSVEMVFRRGHERAG